MKLKKFLGYLNYRECEEIEKHRIHMIYTNKNQPSLVASVPIPKTEELHPHTIYHICNALGIDMPDEYEDIQRRLDEISLYENGL